MKLNSFKTKYKKESTLTTHQFDWLRERSEQQEQRARAERVLRGCVASMVLGKKGTHAASSSSSSTTTTEAVDDDDVESADKDFDEEMSGILRDLDAASCVDDRFREQDDESRSLRDKLLELRSILSALKGSSMKTSAVSAAAAAADADNSPQGGGEAELPALFASLLLSLRASLQAYGSGLDDAESSFAHSVRVSRQSVLSSLRSSSFSFSCNSNDAHLSSSDAHSTTSAPLPDELAAYFLKLQSPANPLAEVGALDFALLRSEVEASLKAVEEEYQQCLEDLSPSAESTAASITATTTASAPTPSSVPSSTATTPTPTSTLTPAQHTTFVKIVSNWESTSKAGGLAKLHARLSLELPTVPSAQYNALYSHYTLDRTTKSKRVDAKAAHDRKIQSLVVGCLTSGSALEKSVQQRYEAEILQRVSRALAEERHERLRLQRLQADSERQQADVLEARAKEHRDAEDAGQRARDAQEHRLAKARVEAYREALDREKDLEARMAAAAEEEEDRRRRQRMQDNEERIEYRSILGVEKMRQLEHEAQLLAMQEAEKEDRLLRLAKSVPYYQALLDAKADLSKMTVARENDVYAEDTSGLLDFQVGASKLRSFTNEKVFSDVRFRLGVALHAAGMSQTVAARDMVKRIIPREAERTTGIKPF